MRRRGGEGSILNLKSEYNRCHITRMVLEEEEDEDQSKKHEEQLAREECEKVEEYAERLGTMAIEERKADYRLIL